MKKPEYNLTTNFALPLLGWRKSMFEPYLVNTYILHEGIEHFQTDHIFVLLKESMDEKYKKLESTIIAHRSHVSQYYVDDKNEYTMHVFKFVDEVLPDYHLFLEGKYSKMSAGAKALIQKSSKIGGVNYKILSRHVSLATLQANKTGVPLEEGAEVWSWIQDANNIKNELFTDALFEIIRDAN